MEKSLSDMVSEETKRKCNDMAKVMAGLFVTYGMSEEDQMTARAAVISYAEGVANDSYNYGMVEGFELGAMKSEEKICEEMASMELMSFESDGVLH